MGVPAHDRLRFASVTPAQLGQDTDNNDNEQHDATMGDTKRRRDEAGSTIEARDNKARRVKGAGKRPAEEAQKANKALQTGSKASKPLAKTGAQSDYKEYRPTAPATRPHAVRKAERLKASEGGGRNTGVLRVAAVGEPLPKRSGRWDHAIDVD